VSARPSNELGAEELPASVGGEQSQDLLIANDPGDLAATSLADASGYGALQEKAGELVGSARSIAQFLDRGTRPDLASTVMIPQLQTFIKSPRDVGSILDDIEGQKKSIFVSRRSARSRPPRSEPPDGALPAVARKGVPLAGRPPRRRAHRLSLSDRAVVLIMILVPTALVVGLVRCPALSTVALSFTRWNGTGGLETVEGTGTENYRNVFTDDPPFPPAMEHNLIWLPALFAVATRFGMFLAVLLDKEIRFSRFYQTALYLSVVLSMALVGSIWRLLYSKDRDRSTACLGTDVDCYGDSDVNLWAVLDTLPFPSCSRSPRAWPSSSPASTFASTSSCWNSSPPPTSCPTKPSPSPLLRSPPARLDERLGNAAQQPLGAGPRRRRLPDRLLHLRPQQLQ
jgi:hypothetical protein